MSIEKVIENYPVIREQQMKTILNDIQNAAFWKTHSEISVFYEEQPANQFISLEFYKGNSFIVRIYLTDLGNAEMLARESDFLLQRVFFQKNPQQGALAVRLLSEFVRRARFNFWGALPDSPVLPDEHSRMWLNWWTGAYEDNYGQEVSRG
jgi:hypothetical protein